MMRLTGLLLVLLFTIPVAAGQVGPDPGVALQTAAVHYDVAKNTRDSGNHAEAVTLYLATVDELVPLTLIDTPGPINVQGTNRIDRVARRYLQKIGHDLGGSVASTCFTAWA